jgi:hypothetical protein
MQVPEVIYKHALLKGIQFQESYYVTKGCSVVQVVSNSLFTAEGRCEAISVRIEVQ